MAEVQVPDRDEAPPLEVNLQIISPSVGVSAPLSFRALPSKTTIRELKAMIREAIPLRPSNDHQRLIHRGRLLSRDPDTLEDVFGAETLRNVDVQTLHLVLRDTTDHIAPTPSQPTPAGTESPAPGTTRHDTPPPDYRPPQMRHHPMRQVPPQFPAIPGAASPFGPGVLDPSLHAAQLQQQQRMQAIQHQHQIHLQHQLQQQQQQHQQFIHQQYQQHLNQQPHHQPQPPPQFQQHQQHHQNMMQWMNQLQRDAGRVSPAPQQAGTVTREMIGPSGQYIRMTFNTNGGAARTASPQPAADGPTSAPRAQLSPEVVQNLVGRHDTAQATQTMTDAMHRSASGTSLANLAAGLNGPVQPVPPGVTTPVYANLSRHASRTATPDPAGRAPSQPGNLPPPARPEGASWPPHQTMTPVPADPQPSQQPSRSQQQPQQTRPASSPEVYILSSPAGPRGLLMHGGLDVYVTPAAGYPTASAAVQYRNPYPLRRRIPSSVAPRVRAAPSPAQLPGPQQEQEQPQRQQVRGRRQRSGQQPRQQQQQGHPIPVRRAPVIVHPNNPGAGALVAALWPHIWLLIRLAAFVWWFTSADSSWTRWFTIVAMAVAVFLINTGLMNGFANQAWDPVRRHLEGLLPLADPNRPGEPAAPAPAPAPRQAADAGAERIATGTGRRAEPDPAQAAARLVAERRNDNAHWLLDQVRRAERAGLLFLASIAPGVAERHIAHLEAQERAERQRREEEEAAAVAAAAAAVAATATSVTEETAGTAANLDGPTPTEDSQTNGSGEAARDDQAPPLVEV